MTKFMWVYNLVLPILCYIIGVICGQRSVIYASDIAAEAESEPIEIDDDCINHVGYTPEQMGYDK